MERDLHQQVVNLLTKRCYGQRIITNTWRGAYVEALVCSALGDPWKLCSPWGSWDLENDRGYRVEVKQAAALQNWESSGPHPTTSHPRFDIAPCKGHWDDDSDDAVWIDVADLPEGDVFRPADVYIFAWHKEQNPAVADHRKAEQWRFFVVPERLLTERHKDQRTIGLTPLEEMASPVGHKQLAEAVTAALSALYQQDAEDYHRAVAIMERVRSGEMRVYSDAEIRADLDLDG